MDVLIIDDEEIVRRKRSLRAVTLAIAADRVIWESACAEIPS